MTRVPVYVAVTALLVVILAPSAGAHQKGWPGKRLSQTFPEAAKFTSRQVTLSSDQLGRIEQVIGERVEAESRTPTFYPAFNKAGEKIGFVLFADQVGENGPIEMGVSVDSEGKVHNVVVLSSREDKRIGQAAFLNQFQGKPAQQVVKPGAELVPVAGAERASQAVITGVRKVLLIKQEVFGDQNP
jgi:Na+-translocating ferredoxin:NAD+ oxidoreductase RnfG subunit